MRVKRADPTHDSHFRENQRIRRSVQAQAQAYISGINLHHQVRLLPAKRQVVKNYQHVFAF